MYAISRATYKELAPHISKEPVNPSLGTNRELVLHACEDAMTRLGDDFRHFPHPERYLFDQVRAYFPITEQLNVFNIIQRNVALAGEVVQAYANKGFKPDGTRLRCRATTRRSTPCMRNIVIGTEYCPSHQHLAEPHFGFEHTHAA